jgi:hypothetical protein
MTTASDQPMSDKPCRSAYRGLRCARAEGHELAHRSASWGEPGGSALWFDEAADLPDETLRVTAAEWVDIRGVGRLAIVSADQIPTTPKFGDSLMIDGSPYRVVSVERQPSNPPRYVINGFYGLMVQPQSRGATDE